MKQPNRRKRFLQSGILLLLGVILVFIFFSLNEIKKIETRNLNIAGERESLSLAQKVVSQSIHHEINVQGYVFPGKENFLTHEKPLPPSTDTDINRLKYINQANPLILQKIDSLQKLVKTRLAEQEKLELDLNNKTLTRGQTDTFLINEKIYIETLRSAGKDIENNFGTVLKVDEKTDLSNINFLRSIFYISLFIFLLLIVLIVLWYHRNIVQLQAKNSELENLSFLIDQSEDAVISIDTNFKFLTFSKGAERISGYTAEEAFKNSELLFTNLDYPNQESRNENRKIMLESGRWTSEVKFTRKNGSTGYLFISMTALRNNLDAITGFVGFIRDITERINSEEKSYQLAKIIENTSDAIFTTDKFTQIKSWNFGAEKLYGYTSGEAVGKKSLELLRVPQSLINFTAFDFTKNSCVKNESIHYRKNGEAIIVDVSLNYIAENYDNGYFLILVSDVTEKKAEEKRMIELANSFALTRDTIILLDKNQTILGWNKGAIKMYGYTEKEAIGKNVNELIVQNITFNEETALTNSNQSYWRGEGKHIKKDGTIIPVILSVTYLKDENDKTTGYLALVIDITEQKLMEERLRNMNGILEYEVEEKTSEIRDVFERITEGFLAMDNNYRLTYANKAVVKLLNLDVKDVIGKNILLLLTDLDKNIIRAYERAKEEQHFIQLEDYFPMFNAWLYVSMYPSAKGVSVFLKDITSQKKAQEDLAKMNYRLRNLSAHIQNSREEERMNIAREIHDELGQLTTALKIDMAWVKKRIVELDGSPKSVGRVEDMLGLLHEMVTTIRRISQELRPSILDNLGLSAAVEWYLKEFEKRTTIKTTFINQLDDEDEQLPNIIKTNLFRICQESLTNVMRHAQATKVDCELKKINNKKIVLQITDNGKGFDMNQKTKSFGLLGMQERAGMMNGVLTIKSEFGAGSSIHVEVEI
jgi:PAS domain S-box-containing protein